MHSILKTLKDQHLHPTYGFINAAKLTEHPEDLAVLKTWRAANQPLGNQVAAARHIKIPANSKPYKELQAICH